MIIVYSMEIFVVVAQFSLIYLVKFIRNDLEVLMLSACGTCIIYTTHLYKACLKFTCIETPPFFFNRRIFCENGEHVEQTRPAYLTQSYRTRRIEI